MWLQEAKCLENSQRSMLHDCSRALCLHAVAYNM